MARKGLPKKYAKMGFKKGWRAFKAAKRRRKSPVRKKARRAPARRRGAVKVARRRKTFMVHPSITGLAAGFSVLDDLNRGDVIDMALKGNASGAVKTLSANSQNLIKTESGRQALLQAIGIAAIGSFARRALPKTKIGGSKFYFNI